MPAIGPQAAAPGFTRSSGLRDDPYLGYNFLVEIQGLLAGGFTEISGLDVTTDVEEVRQGGVNSHSYKLPRGSSYSDLVLKHGITDVDMMWSWYMDVVNGKVQRRNGTIYLLNASGSPVLWWNFFRAYPVAWSGPSFDASSSTVLFSTITLAHEGLDNSVSAKVGNALKGQR